MEVLYFLKERTKLIRQHYDTAAGPFVEIMRKIEDEEEPYVPPYSEDDEPAFLSEWLDAQTSLTLLGLSCISMLSESLRLYFMTWEQELRLSCQPNLKAEFKAGFLNGYKACFGHVLKADWTQCPADLNILEQVVLARNRAQHPDSLVSMNISHSGKDREKYPMPFFIGEIEKRALGEAAMAEIRWMGSSLAVSREQLTEAIDNVEKLGEWLEDKMLEAKYPEGK
jgi:hypothetical protein